MDEKTRAYMDSLKKALEDLPQSEVKDALEYYEEYLNDAIEAGKNPEETLKQLGPPETVSAMIRAEASFERVRKNPGIKSFSKVAGNGMKAFTKPVAVFFMALFIIILYGMVILLYAGAAVSVVAALAALAVAGYEAFGLSATYTSGIVGISGFGLFAFGLLLLASLGFHITGRQFIRASSAAIRIITRKQGEPEFISRIAADTNTSASGASGLNNSGASERSPSGKRTKTNLAAFVLLIITVAGLALFSLSGLPIKYFTIFNSMKPDNITLKQYEADPASVESISVRTIHSCVRLERGVSEDITIIYEQPDWLMASVTGTKADLAPASSGSGTDDITASEGVLSFTEESADRLPLLSLARLHESRSFVTVVLPAGYSPEAISIESTGGFVYLSGIEENIKVKTFTGSVIIDTSGIGASYGISAKTGTGILNVGGAAAGEPGAALKSSYSNGVKGNRNLSVESARGNISIGDMTIEK